MKLSSLNDYDTLEQALIEILGVSKSKVKKSLSKSAREKCRCVMNVMYMDLKQNVDFSP